MKYLTGLAVLSVVTSQAIAGDKPIEGGFGVKLGEPIEQRLVEHCKEDDKATLCILKPDAKHSLFSQYIVALEPKESKVVYIEASTVLADGCQEVKEKLGTLYSQEYYNFQQEPYLWGYGNKIASLSCQETDAGYKLSFHLTDAELQSKS